MSKRGRKKNPTTTTSSKIFNFISPMPLKIEQIAQNYDYTDKQAVFAYGPIEINNNGPNPDVPIIYFPQGATVQGRRRCSNISIQSSLSYCQVNPNNSKYELFYPNCSSYLITCIMKSGTNLGDIQRQLFRTSTQITFDARITPVPTSPPINCILLDRYGECGLPVNNILDIQPLRTCNGNIQAPQYINQVYIPGPIELDQDDYIVTLVIIPSSYTFTIPYPDQNIFLQGMAIVRYDINF